MSNVTPNPNPAAPRRPGVLAKLSLAAAFVLVLAAVAFWTIRSFVLEPNKTIIIPPDVIAEAQATPATKSRAAQAQRNPNSRPTFSGKVIDAVTKQPIPNFTLRMGYNYGPGQSTYFNAMVPKAFKAGAYKMTAPFYGGSMVWLIRIDAPGHLPSISEAQHKTGKVDFELTAGTDIKGAVLDTGGNPVAGAQIVMAVPGLNVYLDASDIKSVNANGFHATTGGDGHFDLPPQTGSIAVAAAADQGFAEINEDASSSSNLTLRLAPWGQIAGQLIVAGKPGAQKEIYVNSVDPWQPTDAHIGTTASTTTGADGKFILSRVAPGSVQISRMFPQNYGRHNTNSYRTQTENGRVVSGQTLALNIGGKGRPVIGHLKTDSGKLNMNDYFPNQNINGITMPDPPPQMPANVRAASVSARQLWMNFFKLTPAGRAYVATHPDTVETPLQYAMEISPDGSFRIEDVVPGDYTIWLYLNSVNSGANYAPVQTAFTMPPVPEGYSDKPLVLPDLVFNKQR